MGKAAAGLVVAVLTVGAGSAAAMAATGHKPGEVAHGAAQIVEACKDTVRGNDPDKGSHGIGKCVSAAVHKRNDERKQQETEAKDTDKNESASPSPKSSHQDHGQGAGGGSVGAPGQGGSGNGSSDSNHGHSSGHGHQPSPKPSA